MNTDLKIKDMTDDEIIPLVEMCSYMFGVHRIADGAVTAFAYMLKSKFPLMRGEKIIQVCTEAAANQGEREIKFTPSVLANILYANEKQYYGHMSSVEKITTETERINYRREFLKSLYDDFNMWCIGEKPKEIHAWEYVARLLERAGFTDTLPVIKKQKINEIRIGDVFESHKQFVLNCFKKIKDNNEHISKYIHGIN